MMSQKLFLFAAALCINSAFACEGHEAKESAEIYIRSAIDNLKFYNNLKLEGEPTISLENNILTVQGKEVCQWRGGTDLGKCPKDLPFRKHGRLLALPFVSRRGSIIEIKFQKESLFFDFKNYKTQMKYIPSKTELKGEMRTALASAGFQSFRAQFLECLKSKSEECFLKYFFSDNDAFANAVGGMEFGPICTKKGKSHDEDSNADWISAQDFARCLSGQNAKYIEYLIPSFGKVVESNFCMQPRSSADPADWELEVYSSNNYMTLLVRNYSGTFKIKGAETGH